MYTFGILTCYNSGNNVSDLYYLLIPVLKPNAKPHTEPKLISYVHMLFKEVQTEPHTKPNAKLYTKASSAQAYVNSVLNHMQ